MFTPKSIQQALCLAKLQEYSSKAQKNKLSSKPLLHNPVVSKTYSPSPATNTNPYPSPMSKAPFTKPSTPLTLTHTTHMGTLTLDELSGKRAKTYVSGVMKSSYQVTSAKRKKPQLFHIEMEDDEDECT